MIKVLESDMDRDELIKFLKKNLSVDVDVSTRPFDCTYVTVKLTFDGEVISESSDSITLGKVSREYRDY